MPHIFSRRVFKSSSGQKCILKNRTYTLQGKIGDGAVGVVRKATRDTDHVTVAIKFLAPDPKYIEETSFDDVAARFRHEGERGAKLDHPRLVKILGYADNANAECFPAGGPKNPFLMMEYVAGRTLESEIRRTPAEAAGRFEVTRERLFIAIQIADAVQYIHQKKLVHRDVKPANIFISSCYTRDGLPRIKLGDFGVVKWGDFHQSVATGTLTMTHQQGLGTLKYMSPEQAIRPKEVTGKSDIFSLGITLYELLTGTILSSPHHVFQVMNARLSRGSTGVRMLELGHRIDPCYDYLCERLLDCFLRGIDGRPKANDILGCLSAAYAREYDEEWTREFTKG
jgi:serine/threonine-protein kinase